MRPGDVVADRFRIEGIAGKGGMGTVFRATDAVTGNVVALKIVDNDHANARFEREAMLLASFEHPGIVRYFSHGRLTDGQMYLAMEWLAGRPLDERLRKGDELTIADATAMAITLARALGAAHAKGIVHRDVKPSNVILRSDDPSDAVLVDFGIARAGKSTRALTATGAVIGTPAYMAPEQARGERTVDARADVFSLGCVLFECLCGRAPFVGEHVIAVLAKILLEPAPRVRSLRADVPLQLDELVASMLHKTPSERLENGEIVAGRLEGLARKPTLADRPPVSVSGGRGNAISVTERRFATVLLARAKGWLPIAEGSETDALAGVTDESTILEAAASFGMSIVPLADGMFVGAEVAADAGPDAAHRAARCALELRIRMPDCAVAIATGRAIVADQVPVGDAIDRAARLLAEGASAVRIDEATASMIEQRFELERDNARRWITLVRERELEVRTIMGRVVPFVGREREIAMLEATFRECIDEPIARAMIVIAPPGTGKTRLQRELVTRLSTNASPNEQPRVWIGLADPMMARAPLAFAGEVLRRAIGLSEGEPLATRQEKILARVRRVVSRQPERVAMFLGEIAGAPSDSADPTLRAARQSPELLASQIDDAVVAFVNGELESGPLLLVLEDVHWADAASLRLFSTLLSRSKERPLMMLALARPGLSEAHPKLWEELRCQRVVLEPLLRKASERLARAVLGDRPEVEAIVRKAEGNALFVEELARACLEGRAYDDLPPTVAAATEARVAAFDADTRQALRAAAVFGERFWSSGVAKLLDRTPDDVAVLIARLEELELVSHASESRFAGEREYVFRHALVRDAAYAMFTDEDCQLGHALAADWLEPFGDEMADVLALNFSLAGRHAKAAIYGRKAAQKAIRVNRYSEGLALLEGAKASLGELPQEECRDPLIELLLEQEVVCDHMGDRKKQEEVLNALLSLLVLGRDDATLATVHTRYGELFALSNRTDEAQRSLDLALGLSRGANDLVRERTAVKGMAFLAWQQARYAVAAVHNARALELARTLKDPGVGRDLVNLGTSLLRIGDVEGARACLDESLTLAEDPRAMVQALGLKALYFAKVGDVEQELEAWGGAFPYQDEHGLWPHKLITLNALAGALRKHGRPEEALARYEELVQLARTMAFHPQLAVGLKRWAELLVQCERPADAIPLFEQGISVWMSLGQPKEALSLAESAARASRGMPDPTIAQRCYESAADLAKKAGEPKREGDLLNTLGIVHYAAGEWKRALEAYERALAVFEALEDRVHCSLMLNSAAAMLQKMGEHARAQDRLEASLRHARGAGERLLEGHALSLMGDGHLAQGDPKTAHDSYEASLRLRRELGDVRGEGWMLQKLATIALSSGETDRARSLFDEARRCAAASGDRELEALCAKMD